MNFFKKYPLIFVTVLVALIVGGTIGTQKAIAFFTPQGSSSSPQVSSSSQPTKPNGTNSTTSSKAQPKTDSSTPTRSTSATIKHTSVPKEPAVSSLVTVKTSYFDDALFIGDSLTDGMRKYGDLGNASFFSHVGLSIYQLFESPKGDDISGLTLIQTLSQHHYSKIYIMSGINEMGTGDTAYFVKHYSEVLTKIHQLQPSAKIYIESILPVTADKSENDRIFNNKNISNRNDGLKSLKDNKTIFYLDVASSFEDSNGNMPDEYSGDGIHPKAKYYLLWKNYLFSHAVQ
ncbi:MAG: GDSL-type esterase/lipase family protein [Bacillota bacterium]|nr:GDSL-type esterase/lipase family protein [Bacillota bacterium]